MAGAAALLLLVAGAVAAWRRNSAVCGLSFRVKLAYLSFRRNRAVENVPSTAPPSLREARLRPDVMVLTALQSLQGPGFSCLGFEDSGLPDLSEALGPLLLAQGPVLLQLLQLWGVLAALQDSGAARTEEVEWDQEPHPSR